MKVSWIKSISVAGFSGVQALHLRFAMRISVHTMSETSLHKHLERRNVSAGGSGFGKIWMPADELRKTGIEDILL